jgi:hypothetical protein
LSAHHNSRSLGGDHHGIHGLIDAGDSIEMGFEEPRDRYGAFNQGAGRPVDGKKNCDIAEHAGRFLAKKGLVSTSCNHTRARLRWFDLSHAWQWLHGPESMATASLTRGGTVPPQFLGSYREKFEGRERGRKAKRLSKTKSGAPVARRT